jgi:hypothetical protein
MRFQTPQFIDIEDKIFGPLTWKQFLYLAGGIGVLMASLTLIESRFIAIILSAPIVGLACALAFLKINNRPFSIYLEALIRYATTSRLYIWKKERRVATASAPTGPQGPLLTPSLTGGKLKSMSWELDVKKELPVDSEPDIEK